MAADTPFLGFQVQYDGLVIGVLGDYVEVAIGVGSNLASDFESEDEIERVASHNLGPDDAELGGVLLGEQGDLHRKFFLILAEEQIDEGIFARDAGQVRFADGLVVDEDVLGAWHGDGWWFGCAAKIMRRPRAAHRP